MNRKLAIECIETQRQFVDDLTRDALDMAIDVLEQTAWIPCNERLPEESGLYIVTNVGRWVEPVGTRYYNIRTDGGFWSGHPGDKVLAWMELPKPYGGDTDETD